MYVVITNDTMVIPDFPWSQTDISEPKLKGKKISMKYSTQLYTCHIFISYNQTQYYVECEIYAISYF